jgi:hypothetical protein
MAKSTEHRAQQQSDDTAQRWSNSTAALTQQQSSTQRTATDALSLPTAQQHRGSVNGSHFRQTEQQQKLSGAQVGQFEQSLPFTRVRDTAAL